MWTKEFISTNIFCEGMSNDDQVSSPKADPNTSPKNRLYKVKMELKLIKSEPVCVMPQKTIHGSTKEESVRSRKFVSEE